MIERTIYVRASRQEVLDLLRTLPAVARGNSAVAQSLMTRLGLAALGRIKTAFAEKAAGGTDETGLRWQPLSPHTIAYSRRHRTTPGGRRWVPKGSVRAESSPSWMLTKEQRARWWQLYRKFGGTKGSGRAYHQGGSRSWAAARAWKILLAEGARTIMMVFGRTPVQILRDTGLLFNSLSPGVDVGLESPTPPKVDQQVFRTGQAEVIVGTNRRWSGTHHRGVPGRIPQRRLWPDPANWTPNWWKDITEQGLYGLMDVAQHLLGGSL